jgi:nitroreductase
MNDSGSVTVEQHPALLAIAGRRSIYSFADTPVDESDLRLALDMAVLAPNHRLTRPWRFAVFLGEGRERLADAFARAAAARQMDAVRARDKLLIAPAVVCVGVLPQIDRPKVVEREEEHAVAAAIQNMMLALHVRGIGSLWTTGALCNTQEVRDFLGWREPQDLIVGVVHVGYAASGKQVPSRKIDHVAYTIWHR